MILVVFALEEEAKDFRRWLAKNPRGVRVELMGVGAEAVAARLPGLLERWKPDRLIAAGFAGALTEEWQIGDVVCPENFSTVEAGSLRRAVLHSSDEVIEGREERAAIAREAGASCVDMESATVARIAAERGVPLLVLRVITDVPGAPIPVPFGVTYDLARQKVRVAATIFWLMRHPLHWMEFGRFLRTLRFAREALTTALTRSV
jgi:nucleoside phosphorylase